jgi:hypothetical protein
MPSKIELAIDSAPLRTALEQPLALIEPPERRAAIQAYLDATGAFLEHALVDFFSSLAQAITDGDSGLTARVEYRQHGAWLVLEAPQETADSGDVPFEGDLEKVTIRVPSELKSMIDRMAGVEGVSANSWYIRELARTIGRFTRDIREEARRTRRGNRGGGRLRGFVGGE